MSGEFLPLPMAAAVTYLRLVGHAEREPASEGLLDVVASALSVWVPLYGGEPRTRLPDEMVGRGRLCNGATRLRFRDGSPPLENLAILQQDLEAGILEGATIVRVGTALFGQASAPTATA